MPTRYMGYDEWWPVLHLTSRDRAVTDDISAEFSDEELSDLLRVSSEWRAWQKKIAERFKQKDCEPNPDWVLDQARD